MDAVDTVFMGCDFGEDTCESCPVRQKCDALRGTDTKVDPPETDNGRIGYDAAAEVVCHVCGQSKDVCQTCPLNITRMRKDG